MYSFDLIYVQVDLIYLTLDLIYQILTIDLKTDFCPIWRVIKILQRRMHCSQKGDENILQLNILKLNKLESDVSHSHKLKETT